MVVRCGAAGAVGGFYGLIGCLFEQKDNKVKVISIESAIAHNTPACNRIIHNTISTNPVPVLLAAEATEAAAAAAAAPRASDAVRAASGMLVELLLLLLELLLLLLWCKCSGSVVRAACGW